MKEEKEKEGKDSDMEIIESQPLTSGTSSPKAELIALTRPLSLQLTREQTVH